MSGIYEDIEISALFDDALSGQCVALQNVTLTGTTPSEQVLELAQMAIDRLRDAGVVTTEIVWCSMVTQAMEQLEDVPVVHDYEVPFNDALRAQQARENAISAEDQRWDDWPHAAQYEDAQFDFDDIVEGASE